MIPYIQTNNGITLFVNSETRDVENSDPRYQEILDAIKGNEPDLLDVLDEILNRDLRKVEIALSASSTIEVRHGVVYFNGQPVHNSITDRILRMVDEGFDAAPLGYFLARLMRNPSYRVVNSLYDFLQIGQMPITPDGYFLAYKAVRQDYRDIHSGTFDNSIGQLCEMPRNQVNENPEETCSRGLHVCSWDYLPNFSHRNGHVMICKIDPADVVAIPADYNNSKMRVSKYEVVGEHKGYYEDNRQNVLSARSVVAEYGSTQPAFDFEDAEVDLDDELDLIDLDEYIF